MRAPLAGKREAVRRVAEEVRRHLAPVERVLPVRLPWLAAPRRDGTVAPVPRDEPAAPDPEDAAARIDAARERLRASIDPPADDRDD